MTELTNEEIKETSEMIVEALQIFADMGVQNMDQLNMCHTCGNMIIKCKCENCQCNMHKAYRKRWVSHNLESGSGKQ